MAKPKDPNAEWPRMIAFLKGGILGVLSATLLP
ncbi:hypothetical protein GGR30_000560 [Martelella radicis]|uniref:Uncharacterized protein n=1 Tax=Martelella radicis TaxID=1397476 RepID=A0A7W6KIS6_9HYPH|nr:hypothetical protein [Martelella radicis]